MSYDAFARERGVEREREGRKLLTAPPLSLSHVASPAAFPIGKPVREFSLSGWVPYSCTALTCIFRREPYSCLACTWPGMLRGKTGFPSFAPAVVFGFSSQRQQFPDTIQFVVACLPLRTHSVREILSSRAPKQQKERYKDIKIQICKIQTPLKAKNPLRSHTKLKVLKMQLAL